MPESCHQDRKGGAVLELLFHLSICGTGFPYEKVVQRVLYLQVLDYDRFSRNDPIGEVSIPLNKVDLTQMQTFWKDLKPCSDGSVRPWTPPIALGKGGDPLSPQCPNRTGTFSASTSDRVFSLPKFYIK